MIQKFAFQLKEQKTRNGYSPSFLFLKDDITTLRIYSIAPASWAGTAYAFSSFPRTWLHGKKVNLTWSFTTLTNNSDVVFYFIVADGAYNRTSETDFPPAGATATTYLSKGNGLLQTIRARQTTLATTTDTATLDLSGGSEADATLMVYVKKHHASSINQELLINSLTITDSSDVLLAYADNGRINLESFGADNDYGICGETVTWTDNYLVDRGRSRARMQGYSLGGGWGRNFT